MDVAPEMREMKQQPSMLPGPPVPGCCLISFHFLWAIRPVLSHCDCMSFFIRWLFPTIIVLQVCMYCILFRNIIYKRLRQLNEIFCDSVAVQNRQGFELCKPGVCWVKSYVSKRTHWWVHSKTFENSRPTQKLAILGKIQRFCFELPLF